MTEIKPIIANANSTLSVPIHHSKHRIINNSHLPPSPSTSSSVSSYTNNSSNSKARDLSLKIPNGQQKYGSLGSSTPYLESLSAIERPLTPSQTTISPNDDDEGLYLLWTQQLLREKGFTPSSCRPEFEDYLEKHKDQSSSKSLENEDSDDDSSVSDMSFSSDDDDDMEDDDNDRYIAEQRKLLLNSPAPSAFRSHQPSLISRYSTNNYAAEVTEDDNSADAGLNAPSQNPIYSIFKSFFSSCF